MKSLISLIAFVLLTGCSSPLTYDYDAVAEARLIDDSLGNPELVPGLPALELNDEIRLKLDQKIEKTGTDRSKLRALRTFLFDAAEANISYDASTTQSAVDTFTHQKGNCLSLTTLFIASARYIGLDAHYRTVNVKPSWAQDGDTMIRYEHIIASGLVDGDKYVIDFLPEFGGNGRGIPISDTSAQARFHSNLGAQLIVDGHTRDAVDEFRKALSLDPKHSATWNNIGAAQFRAGNIELAEFSYHRAIQLDEENYSALTNLLRLYKSEGRLADAAKVDSQVRRYRDLNPYYFFSISKQLFEQGRYDEAILSLKRSIRLAPEEPEFNTAIAEVYAHNGDEASSKKYLILAEKQRQNIATVPEERILNHRFITTKTFSRIPDRQSR